MNIPFSLDRWLGDEKWHGVIAANWERIRDVMRTNDSSKNTPNLETFAKRRRIIFTINHSQAVLDQVATIEQLDSQLHQVIVALAKTADTRHLNYVLSRALADAKLPVIPVYISEGSAVDASVLDSQLAPRTEAQNIQNSDFTEKKNSISRLYDYFSSIQSDPGELNVRLGNYGNNLPEL